MKAKIIFFILLIILSILFIFAQDKPQKKIMTHEDMIAMKRIGIPSVSPNGKFIVFPLEKVDYDEKKNALDINLSDSNIAIGIAIINGLKIINSENERKTIFYGYDFFNEEIEEEINKPNL